MKKFIILFLFILPLYISSFFFKTAFFNNETIVVNITDKNLHLDLEDYIFGVLAAEMPASFEEEALKAQAVAIRSFTLNSKNNNEINLTTVSQAYATNENLKSKWQNDYQYYYQKLKKIVSDTKNEVVKRDGKVLKTYYFSMSNGFTENSNDVFNEDTFSSVKSSYELSLSNFEKTKTISKEDLSKIFNMSNINFTNKVFNNTHHVKSIEVNNKKYSGIEIRKLLNLRSTDFDINETENSFIFTTRGYGHGVGMSQYGANEMAKQGYLYDQILSYYYQNTTLEKI